ncbi:DgyrCDS1516 [Dimorphilus gyrociliatus]|uniref:DgyrCDS1516 n=1 Tax=Dimorphilus gyrociliatus TaxID=2664684 RepID=A0A7I8V7G9_9ANNE|nr:DgyrCDS1516 [Dimorphilus gyrociliatus]
MGKTRKKSTASKTVLKFDEELRSTYLAAHSQQKRKSKKEKNKQKKETKIVKNKVEPPKSNSKRTFNISEREETEETNSETIKLPNHVVTITHLFQGASNANDEDERTELDEEVCKWNLSLTVINRY